MPEHASSSDGQRAALGRESELARERESELASKSGSKMRRAELELLPSI